MNDNNMLIKNTLGFIGIAKKSGMLICGEDASLEAVDENKVRLLITASDISYNTAKRIDRAVRIYSVRHMRLPYTAEELGGIVGFERCSVCAVLDTKIASELADRLAEISQDDNDMIMAAKLRLARHRQIERQLKKKADDLDLKKNYSDKKKQSKTDKSADAALNAVNELTNDVRNSKTVKKKKIFCEKNSNTLTGVQKERGSR